MRTNMPVKIPKVREYARVTMVTKEVLTGYFFIEATSRIQDVLNSDDGFFPFITEGDELRILGKLHVVSVEKWRKRGKKESVYEDRGLDITSETPISVEKQVAKVEKALARAAPEAG